MKKLAIYFGDSDDMGNPFNPKYEEVWRDMIREIEKYNIQVYMIREKNSYLGKGTFSRGWYIKNDQPFAISEPITVDLIFHRGGNSSIPASYDCPMINHPDLERLCNDKVKIAKLFADISPKTEGVGSYKEFLQVVSDWALLPQDMIVLKKNFMSGGKGVKVLPVKDVAEILFESWNNTLVQEFIDSSVGIPGLVEGLHDLRVVTINGEPVHTYVRTPKSGSFLANTAQGGTALALDLDKLPLDLLVTVKRINKEFIQYRPSILGIDFFNSKNGFKLIEINAPSGIIDPKLSPQDKVYRDKTVQMLVGELYKQVENFYSKQPRAAK